MKIFLSTLYQETNSFSPVRTDLAQFRREKLLEGAAAVADARGANLELTGMLEEIPRQFPSAQACVGLHAWSVAAGPVDDDAFAELAERVLAPLRAARPVDAVLLSLHGSMGTASHDDAEGELLRRIRELVGPDVPLAVALDSHAAVTALMLRCASVLVGYRTYPHVDMADTGRRTVAALARWLAGGRRERAVVRRWPALIPVDNAQTDSGPMARLWAGFLACEDSGEALTLSIFCTHPWFDTVEHGVTLVAYARPENAARLGERMELLLREVWLQRDAFLLLCPTEGEFFARRREWPAPVAAIDAGDITTAGAPGDSTVLLRAARQAGGVRVLLPLVDLPAVDAAWAAGAGATVDFQLGAADDPAAYNARVPLRARVAALSDAPLRIHGAAFGGITLPLGPRALLEAGSLQVMVLRHGSLFHDPELWRSVGVEPGEADVIVQKSHKLFRPAYASIARSIVTLDTPGCTDRQLARLPYRRVRRPMFPLDEGAPFTVIQPDGRSSNSSLSP